MEDTLIEASDIDPPVEISLNGDTIRIIKAFKNYIALVGEPVLDGNKMNKSKIFCEYLPKASHFTHRATP